MSDPRNVLFLSTGNSARSRRAYVAAFASLRLRVEVLLALPLDALDRHATQSRLREIGQVGV